MKEFKEDHEYVESELLITDEDANKGPMDILPRVFDKFWLPPKCPLDSVTFVK